MEKKKKKAHSKRCAQAVVVSLAPADGVEGKFLFVTWIHKPPPPPLQRMVQDVVVHLINCKYRSIDSTDAWLTLRV